MIKENRFIRLRDGIKIHAQVKEVGGPFWVVLTHGLGEHLGRHNYMIGLFNNNFNIFQYDLRGHGKSEGKRAYVKNFITYVEDLAEILRYIEQVFKGTRIVLVGHSMGALITAGYLQNLAPKGIYPECVFLSAPPMAVPSPLGKVLSFLPRMTKGLTRIPLSVPLGGMVDIHRLSHDGRVWENYLQDELNCLKIHSHLLFGLLDYANQVFTRPLRAKCPLACAYGTEDTIVDVAFIKDYFTHLEKKAQIFALEGAYHEMHNEIAKFRVPYFNYFVKFVLRTFFQEED